MTLNATEVIQKVGTNVFVDYLMQIVSLAPEADQARLIAKLLVAVKANDVEQQMPQLWNPHHPFLGALEEGKKSYLAHQAQNEAKDANEGEPLTRQDALPYSARGQRPLIRSDPLPNKKARTTLAPKPTLSLSQEIEACKEIAEADLDWYTVDDPVIGSDPGFQSSQGTTLGSARSQHYSQVTDRLNNALDEGENRALVPYTRSSQISTRASQSCSAGPSNSSPPASESRSASFADGGGGGGPTSASFADGGGGGELPNTTSLRNVAVALALLPGLYETGYVRVQLVGNGKFGHLVIKTYHDHDWVDRMKAGYPSQTRPLGAKDTKICLICGGISYASKSCCTYNGCWAQGVDYVVLHMLTEVSMTHTAARKKVR
jgi:hypothetical protein